MSNFKDYTNTTITNNYGEKIKILSLEGKNSSGTYKWFYECVYCKNASSDTISNIKKSKGCKTVDKKEVQILEKLVKIY